MRKNRQTSPELDRALDALMRVCRPLPPFKPCVVENEAMRLTEVILEDVGYVAVPAFKGVHHTVDWLLAMDDHRIVGVQVWALKDDNKE